MSDRYIYSRIACRRKKFSMNIVAVDDELPALNLLLDAISEVRPEAEINGFYNPDELIEYVKDNKVDIACLDYQIYEITGVELARTIKRINPQVKVIFVTAYGENISKEIKTCSGGLIRKPVTAQDVEREFDKIELGTVIKS